MLGDKAETWFDHAQAWLYAIDACHRRVRNLYDTMQPLSRRAKAVLMTITLVPLYYAAYTYRLRHPYSTTSTRPATTSGAEFMREWLDVQMPEDFDPYPIATYCNQSTWNPNLVFNLDSANGGIGNIRGNFLDFFFFAIEMGGSIMLPDMGGRAADDLVNLWATRQPFDTYFDEEWFIKSMERACPQMIIYKPEKGMTIPVGLKERYLPRTRRLDESHVNSKEGSLAHFKTWLEGHSDYKPKELTFVHIERTLFDVDLRSLPPDLRRNFGGVLRVNPTLRRLAALVVQNLRARHGLWLRPTDMIPRHAFYGCHLRSEADAVTAGWLNTPATNFTGQTDEYLRHAQQHELSVVYVASGNANHTRQFKAKAAAHRPPLNVTTKFDLLAADDAAALRALSWDQQAAVDWEVLKRCSVFGGIVKSSFSYNIALIRQQWLSDQGRVTDPWAVLDREADVAFDDGVSRVLGRDDWHEHRIPRGMWP